jgi:hypothetical protein
VDGGCQYPQRARVESAAGAPVGEVAFSVMSTKCAGLCSVFTVRTGPLVQSPREGDRRPRDLSSLQRTGLTRSAAGRRDRDSRRLHPTAPASGATAAVWTGVPVGTTPCRGHRHGPGHRVTDAAITMPNSVAGRDSGTFAGGSIMPTQAPRATRDRSAASFFKAWGFSSARRL